MWIIQCGQNPLFHQRVTHAILQGQCCYGLYLGGFVRNSLNAERFRTVVLLFFMLMGLNLIRRVVMG